MKVLLDTNVLLDVALERGEFVSESKEVLAWLQASVGSAMMAWHTVSNVYYVLRGARNDSFARRFIFDMLRLAGVAGGDAATVQAALALPMSDFEDALQVAAAMSAQAQWIVTRNVTDFRNSPLPAITPRNFVRRFVAV